MVHVQKNSVTRWCFSLGQELPCWEVCAENDAQDSNNPIHDSRVAQQLGFSGGLVPGVTLYGYLTYPLIAVFGRAFLQQGSLDVRFRRPVYAGETVTTLARVSEVGEAGCEFKLELRNAAQEVQDAMSKVRHHIRDRGQDQFVIIDHQDIHGFVT